MSGRFLRDPAVEGPALPGSFARAESPGSQGRVPGRLTRRRDFLNAAKGRRFHAKGFTLQAVRRKDLAPEPTVPQQDAELERAFLGPAPRFGFTVTKKVGGAVLRNRIRRRLKEALRLLDPLPARPGHDYVLIARPEALDLPFPLLQAELATALEKIDTIKFKAGPDRIRRKPEHHQSHGHSPGTAADRSMKHTKGKAPKA